MRNETARKLRSELTNHLNLNRACTVNQLNPKECQGLDVFLDVCQSLNLRADQFCYHGTETRQHFLPFPNDTKLGVLKYIGVLISVDSYDNL